MVINPLDARLRASSLLGDPSHQSEGAFAATYVKCAVLRLWGPCQARRRKLGGSGCLRGEGENNLRSAREHGARCFLRRTVLQQAATACVGYFGDNHCL